MISRKVFICFLICFPLAGLYAQDVTNFTQFFINPYSINPSYAGIEGRGAVSLAYRKQWAGIEGAPSIANLSFHAPSAMGLNYGVSFVNDTKGILSTSAASVTFGYTLTIDKHKFIRFGLSGGAAFNSVDLNEFENTTDPALTDLLDKNLSVIGNAGLSFHFNTVHFGAALPNIFSPSFVSKDAFSVREVKPFQSVIVHASNRFYFAKDKHVFEPYLIYRINESLPSQIEAAAVLHLNHAIWFGGSYKQDFGISALGGLKVQNFFLIGGSYSIKNTGDNELNSPSFEVQLSYIFGAKKKDIPVYSFVNTVKEKERKKSPAQIAAEKKRAEEAKKNAEALAKKKEEEKKLADATKKQQQDAAALAKKQQADAAALAKKQQEEAAALAKKETVTQPVKETVTQPVKETVTQPVKETVTEPDPQPLIPITPVVKKHDGGPRLKSDVLAMDMPTYDTAHHEEAARINRLTEHASDPNEHHGQQTDAHPNAERHEFVKRGNHHEELELGDYVVSGVFKSSANANHYADGLKKLGFQSDYGHLTEKNLWYVYISQSNDINTAKADRDKFRKTKIFRDCWLLTVHQ